MTRKADSLYQLALRWDAQADEDAAMARRRHLVGDEFKMLAHARRNCAWELRTILNDLEKENPTEAGSLSPPNVDCESA